MRYLYKFLMIVLFVAPFEMVFAQDESDYVVSTNRPNQTDAIGVMKPGFIQLESGIGYIGSSNGFQKSDILFLPSIQLRFGIIKNVEINAFYDYSNIKISPSQMDSFTQRNHFFTIGSKIHLWNENGILPEAITVINGHYTNWEKNLDDWDFEIRLIFQNTITERLSFAYMLRVRENLAFTLVPSYSINENWSVFVEYFSDIRFNPDSPGTNQNGINLGIGYLISDRITIDLMYGTTFNDGFSNDLITTGVGWWIR